MDRNVKVTGTLRLEVEGLEELIKSTLELVSPDDNAIPPVDPYEVLFAIIQGKFRPMGKFDLSLYGGIEYDGFIGEVNKHNVTLDVGPGGTTVQIYRWDDSGAGRGLVECWQFSLDIGEVIRILP